MSYITVQEAAKKWGISERLVRRYCAEGRIQDLAQYDGIWQIPEDADKPSRIKKDTINTPQIPPLLKNLIKQRDGSSIAVFTTISRSTISPTHGAVQRSLRS